MTFAKLDSAPSGEEKSLKLVGILLPAAERRKRSYWGNGLVEQTDSWVFQSNTIPSFVGSGFQGWYTLYLHLWPLRIQAYKQKWG